MFLLFCVIVWDVALFGFLCKFFVACMHVWFCRVVCLRACLLVYQLVCRFVGLLAPCFLLCYVDYVGYVFCACLCGWVPKDCTNYHMWVPFWGPIGGNLFSHLMYVFLLVEPCVWTHLIHVAACLPFSPVISLYFHSGMCCQDLSQFQPTQPYLDGS